MAAALGRKAPFPGGLIIAALKLIGPHRSVSTLDLREVAREAGIAPNSFYASSGHGRVAVALIDLAGARCAGISARRAARGAATGTRAQLGGHVHRQMRADDKCCMCCCARHGGVGRLQERGRRELNFFETIAQRPGGACRADGATCTNPRSCQAITRLVFA
jgi:hypothetical protein